MDRPWRLIRSHRHERRGRHGENDQRGENGRYGENDRHGCRGQSELLGTVLIFGLSLLVIGTTLAFGAVAIADLTDEAEATNVENSLSHFSSKVSLVALGDSDTQQYSLSSTRDGTVSVQPDAGEIEVTHTVNGSVEGSTQSPLGAVVYQGANRNVAYQGGGVWTERGGNSSMVSPPEYYYRGATLTLPIIRVDGEGAVSGSAHGDITPGPGGSTRATELGSPLEEGTVTVRVQSEYYEGWFDFFTQRAEGSTVIYHENNTVISELTLPDEIRPNRAISHSGDFAQKGQAGTIDGSRERVGSHRSARPLIESRIDEARANDYPEPDLSAGSTITDGNYFVDGDDWPSGDIDFDTSEGDINIIIDGDLSLDGEELTIIENETNNGVNYYINGSFSTEGNTVVSTVDDSPQSHRNVFLIGEEFSAGGTSELDAIIYAPDSQDSEVFGDATIRGSIFVQDITVRGNYLITNSDVDRDERIDISGAENLVQYLHVSRNEVSVTLRN